MRSGGPSSTALVIAEALALLARDPDLRPFVPTVTAEAGVWFADACSGGRRSFAQNLKSPAFRFFARLRERLTVPGIFLHYLLRKRYIEAKVRESLQDGFRQVVCLGAGFDMLCPRMAAEQPAARFFEVDAPATQAVKRRVLAENLAPTPNLHFVRADLSADAALADLLTSAGLDRARDTLFIAEGLLMYLDRRAVERVTRFVRNASTGRVRFIFTFMERHPNGRINFRNASWAVSLWLWLRGEPFRWGLPPAAVDEFVGECGFSRLELADADRLRAQLPSALANRTLAEGEFICLAETVAR